MVKCIRNSSFYIHKVLDISKIGKANAPLLTHPIVANRAVMAMEKMQNERWNDGWQAEFISLFCDAFGFLNWKCICRWPSEHRASCLCKDYLEHSLPADHGKKCVCRSIGFNNLIMIEKLFKGRIDAFSLEMVWLMSSGAHSFLDVTGRK